ncbi:MAG: hypothetical protein L0Z07_00255, partial [Planctomycetes bacterium]|nr:hypothetical protein [Planctomycetota bacterium]
MNTTCQKLGWAWFLGAIVLCGVSVVSTAAALGQEPAAAVATTATDQATPAADSEATDSNTATTSQAESAASTQDAPPGSSDTVNAPVVPDGAPANNAAAAGNAPAATASKTGLGAFTLALIIFALFALPILIG